MEKNIYQILQEWHELLTSGVITEEEFAEKKKELLGEKKHTQEISPQEDVRIITVEEQTQADAEYEILFDNKSWSQKNKGWLIGLSIVFLIGIAIWIFPVEKNKGGVLTSPNNLIENIEKDSNHKKISSNNLSSINSINNSDLRNKGVNFKIIEGSWLADKEDVFGLKFEKEDKKILCSWVLFMDCALDFSFKNKNDTLFLYGEEFEGGNSFSDFFNTESVKRFNNGSLFCYATLVDQNNMKIHYVDKNFIKDLDDYLGGKLSEKFPAILKKKKD